MSAQYGFGPMTRRTNYLFSSLSVCEYAQTPTFADSLVHCVRVGVSANGNSRPKGTEATNTIEKLNDWQPEDKDRCYLQV